MPHLDFGPFQRRAFSSGNPIRSRTRSTLESTRSSIVLGRLIVETRNRRRQRSLPSRRGLSSFSNDQYGTGFPDNSSGSMRRRSFSGYVRGRCVSRFALIPWAIADMRVDRAGRHDHPVSRKGGRWPAARKYRRPASSIVRQRFQFRRHSCRSRGTGFFLPSGSESGEFPPLIGVISPAGEGDIRPRSPR